MALSKTASSKTVQVGAAVRPHVLGRCRLWARREKADEFNNLVEALLGEAQS
jgi:hypothetical protein